MSALLAVGRLPWPPSRLLLRFRSRFLRLHRRFRSLHLLRRLRRHSLCFRTRRRPPRWGSARSRRAASGLELRMLQKVLKEAWVARESMVSRTDLRNNQSRPPRVESASTGPSFLSSVPASSSGGPQTFGPVPPHGNPFAKSGPQHLNGTQGVEIPRLQGLPGPPILLSESRLRTV